MRFLEALVDVVRAAGARGMGEVFLAYSPAGSPVAVKVIRRDKLDANTSAFVEAALSKASSWLGNEAQ
jgi:hypothetical protein